MRQLRGDDPVQQKIARDELLRRGFNQVELELSRQLLDPSVEVRKRLAITVPRLASVDAVPWLLWLSQDPEPSVRYAALSTLGTTGDPSLLERVEQLARNDHDPQVQALAQHIARQLDAASNRSGLR
jgi:HEAT repeat protein